MFDYIITNKTSAVIATYKGSKVIEGGKEFEVFKYPKEIVKDSCIYYGSTITGRLEGTKNLINVNYKAPIIISEKKSLVFFPTTSIRENHCSWINLDSVLNYTQKDDNNTKIKLKSDENITIEASKLVLENQILRASRLKLLCLERGN